MGEPAGGGYIGRAAKRVEDRRLLAGAGRFVDDLAPPGLCHVAFLRAPYAHARIARLTVEAVRRAPGVVAVLTGPDVRHLGPMPVIRLFAEMRLPPHPILADALVSAVGTPVAAVAAESRYQAEDALGLVDVEYAPLPPLVEAEAALGPGAPVLFPELGTNRAFGQTWRHGDAAAAFAAADHTVRLRVRAPRLAGVALEPRGTLAAVDPVSGELTVWISTQAPFAVRAALATALGLSESRVRVVAPEVGGGFGLKTAPCREEVLVAHLALALHRPVKWVATRGEDFLTTHQGRGGVAEGEVAVRRDGRITGLRARIVYPLGSALAASAAVPSFNHARCLPGAYAIPACEIETAAALTTTPPTGAYRGAGRPEAAFLIERLVDEAARAIGMDPAELRRMNFVPPDAFPFRTATGQVYDSGDYARALDRALERAGYREWRLRQAEARARGEVVGVGLASYVEPAGLGWESGLVRVERTGAVTAVTGASPHGQGHETTFAQVVADHLGVRPEDVAVLHGDTRTGPPGIGTFGSRSVALGGSALVRAATEVREKGRRIAALLLEAAVADVVPAAGGFEVVGAPARRVRWQEVAAAAWQGRPLPPGEAPGLEATAFFQPDGEVWSFGTVVAVVRVDRETGQVALETLVWVDDAGTIVNPLLAEGQLHGGLAQGFGQAFLEQLVYDEQGQLLTGSLLDYALPRADDLPVPVLAKTVTPSPRNPLGAKGIGEAGPIGVPPALVNAVVDALAPFGVRHLDMPLTPEKVWRALRG
ncbi:MAG: xanthine dehydrogenase family protein molybdopterin-binding subunit [Candidatus Rokubacteria bacterium]|nr:xanthine dehydrogenase family protein molybdopterin-binding subunit [Candidatus Rokubacteria bacterium]